MKEEASDFRAQELYEQVKRWAWDLCHPVSLSFPVPNKPDGFCGHKAGRKKVKSQTSETSQDLCENRSGRPSPYGLCGRKATLNLNLCHTDIRSCVKVEVDVPGSPSLKVLMVCVDVKQHWT